MGSITTWLVGGYTANRLHTVLIWEDGLGNTAAAIAATDDFGNLVVVA